MSFEYPPEIYEPRIANRAFVHLIYESELPELRALNWEDDLNRGDNDALLREIKRILEIRGDEVRRGDLIYLEPFLFENPRYLWAPHKTAYWSDRGKLVFNGINVMSLTYDENRYRGEGSPYFIPEQFQAIVEFPIRYWQGRMYDSYVNFNIEKNFGSIDVKEIDFVRDPRSSSTYPLSYFTFTSEGEPYVITALDPNKEQFRYILERQTGFIYELPEHLRYYYGLPFPASPENILYYKDIG